MQHQLARRLAACSVLLAAAACAQVRFNTAELAGVVEDPSGKAVAQARLVLTQPNSGLALEASSGSDGAFRFTLLPPNRYRLEVRAEGYRETTFEELDLALGESASLRVKLSFAPATFTVSATAELPIIDYQRSQQSTLLDGDRVANLPINRRNYLDFALLAPGVVETATIADQSDFRPSVAPTSDLGFAGANGRGNLIAIDGSSH